MSKWGGVTGCLAIARAAREAGRVYGPHFLGGGIGLEASAHVLSAAGGPGLLEIDVNPNPLREAFEAVARRMSAGHLTLSSGPGLGIDDLPTGLLELITLHRDVS